ncbi:MAG: hypothetical protein RLN62_01820 [Rickettsiales bacterium]
MADHCHCHMKEKTGICMTDVMNLLPMLITAAVGLVAICYHSIFASPDASAGGQPVDTNANNHAMLTKYALPAVAVAGVAIFAKLLYNNFFPKDTAHTEHSHEDHQEAGTLGHHDNPADEFND